MRKPDWHRSAIGDTGAWEDLGKIQLDFLVGKGMQPSHYLVDIGCGSLRFGVQAAAYLEVGRYVGVEKEVTLLNAARDIEIPRHGLGVKGPVLVHSDQFDLSSVPEIEFDYAIAQSVFTHLPPELVELCIGRVVERLSPSGRFFANYNEAQDFEPGRVHGWRRDELDDVFYPYTMIESLARNAGATATFIGDWGLGDRGSSRRVDRPGVRYSQMVCFTDSSR
jgi:SAM-dependent methyltransferase